MKSPESSKLAITAAAALAANLISGNADADTTGPCEDPTVIVYPEKIHGYEGSHPGPSAVITDEQKQVRIRISCELGGNAQQIVSATNGVWNNGSSSRWVGKTPPFIEHVTPPVTRGAADNFWKNGRECKEFVFFDGARGADQNPIRAQVCFEPEKVDYHQFEKYARATDGAIHGLDGRVTALEQSYSTPLPPTPAPYQHPTHPPANSFKHSKAFVNFKMGPFVEGILSGPNRPSTVHGGPELEFDVGGTFGLDDAQFLLQGSLVGRLKPDYPVMQYVNQSPTLGSIAMFDGMAGMDLGLHYRTGSASQIEATVGAFAGFHQTSQVDNVPYSSYSSSTQLFGGGRLTFQAMGRPGDVGSSTWVGGYLTVSAQSSSTDILGTTGCGPVIAGSAGLVIKIQ